MGLFDLIFGGGRKPPAEVPGKGPAPAGGGPPKAHHPADLGRLAQRLHVRKRKLAYLLFKAKPLYTTFTIPKHSGDPRVLSAPIPLLKQVQRRILHTVFAHQKFSPACHGFRAKRSILTNARPHVGRPIVIRLDLKDFFPTINYGRVRELFREFNVEGMEAAWLARLCTHEGRLPQGAPTSPAIANAVCFQMDARLLGLARSVKARYTRYADDLTFSGPPEIVKILPLVRRIVKESGFEVSAKKTFIQRRGSCQKVTGVVVNDRPNVPRWHRRMLRAIIHNSVKNGPQSQNRKGNPRFRELVMGHIAFVSMVNPAAGKRLSADAAQIRWEG